MVDRDRAFLHSKLLPPHVSCSLTRFYPAGIQTVDWLVQETLKTSQGHPQSTHPVPGGRPRLRGNDTWRPHEAPRRKAPPRTSLAVATARFLRSTPTDSAVATFGDGGNARDRRRNDAVRGWRRFRTILSTWIPTTSHRESHAIPSQRNVGASARKHLASSHTTEQRTKRTCLGKLQSCQLLVAKKKDHSSSNTASV